MMNELIEELTRVMVPSYERIIGKSKYILYFERLKANNVKEIFRIHFQTKVIRYYCVSYETPSVGISLQRPTDKVTFDTVEDIMEYIYGG